ncbi:bifunctional prephenate dehydrogenase/3-phosphoshikimate 1-carboxyvinyltransferase [Neptunomonas sp. CHC150]|uniref:bifunctional prephenate dehydrogenase/3-phosphoshikimate 1-carboxyvinyltransferase n=1 Tax=Neptunomonas sp. CHC150 TaxID=2998324 RepID=UPI0025B1436F|nr:bifunctional prephenate dehydrogenase/3-phosphoshikimate 1-carboxyvinyltransferase [Neptunomonas sp. CHC150]MDN2661099.1 bifunctional prephenate dehydrogenase/3-phosphoshikimate 1-carboxyvinyltransferase [Neptunomonas sp. CHC150]
MSYHKINRILVIGLGLIGGSLAKALKRKQFATLIAGFDMSPDEVRQGLELDVIDEGFNELAACVPIADLIVLAVPVKATHQVLEQIKPLLSSHTIITDVGSTKANVVAAARDVFGTIPSGFIPGHPIAGSEKSGVIASDDQLFVKHKIILTPLPESDPSAVQQVARMWQATGAEVLQMAVERHDEVLAATSHLPHILAFSLVDTLAREQDSTEIFRYAAGGFRDFTRIAASDPTMWHDICIANKQQLLNQIDNFTAGLAELRTAIEHTDSQAMTGVFTRAKAAREHFNRMLTRSAYSLNRHQDHVTFRVRKAMAIQGNTRVPGDKSISHRAVIMGALAEGVTLIRGFLESEDSLATLQAFRDMGVVIEGPHQGQVKIYGVGLHGLCPPPGDLYLGSSDISMRLLSAILAAQEFDSCLLGDDLLMTKPMVRITQALRMMGAQVDTADGGVPPVNIYAVESLQGIDCTMQVPSAQVKSGLLLAGLYAQGKTTITEPVMTRDHTERMLQHFGVDVQRNGLTVSINPGQTLKAADFNVPGDMSCAAFFIVAAAISFNSDVVIEQVGINPGRSGLIDILRLMGADIDCTNAADLNGEPVVDIHVKYAPLQGIAIPAECLSAFSDELPLVFVAAACAQGESLLKGAAELRGKEQNRVQAMTDGLRKMGIVIDNKNGQISITGGEFIGAKVDSFGDPRIAMALSIAGSQAHGDVLITGCDHVASSFPDFVEIAQKIGLRLQKEET